VFERWWGATIIEPGPNLGVRQQKRFWGSMQHQGKPHKRTEALNPTLRAANYTLLDLTFEVSS